MIKEQIYDEQISPLMKQIISICKENGIAYLGNFMIPTEDDDGLAVLTSLPDEAGEVPASHAEAISILRPGRSGYVQITTTHDDGSKEIAVII